jgi:hypothetical protein
MRESKILGVKSMDPIGSGRIACALPMESIESKKSWGLMEYAGGAQAMRPYPRMHYQNGGLRSPMKINEFMDPYGWVG